jgi:hypothetical protein
MKTWQKYALWAAGTFVFAVSAANLFFMLHDRRDAAKETASRLKAPPPKLADWKRYDFPAAGFSALFPAPPEMKTESPETMGDPEETTDAMKYRMHAAIEGADYRIVASDIPKGMMVDLDAMRALINPGRGMEMVDRKTVGKGASKAYDMTFKSADGSYLRMRAFLMGGKFFQAVATLPQERLNAAETEDFLGSVAALSP